MSKQTKRIAGKISAAFVADIDYTYDRIRYYKKKNADLNKELKQQPLPPPKVEADPNSEILADYEDGKSIKELSSIYLLSIEKIKSIVRNK